jgi:hypothetical protein
MALLFVACRPPQDRAVGQENTNLQVDFEVVGEPKLGEAVLALSLSQDGQPVEGASISVVGDMTHAGMIPVLSEASEQEPGRYLSEGFAFTMAGDWLISVDITLPDGEKQTRELALTVPGK